MELLYIILFITFAVPAAVLEFTDNACFGLAEPRGSNGSTHRPEYLRFRNNYVIIFSLMMGEVQCVLKPE